MKKILKDYFTFNKKERVGIIGLLLVCTIFLVLPYLLPQQPEMAFVVEPVPVVTEAPAPAWVTKQVATRPRHVLPAKKWPVKKPVLININTATADDWKALPGIGDVLSVRIVRFREKLGGFTSVMQVGNTYGLRDSVFRKLIPYLRLKP